MPILEVEIEVWCACGEGLCNETECGTNPRGHPKITVEPCERCLDRKRHEGWSAGYEQAVEDKKSEVDDAEA